LNLTDYIYARVTGLGLLVYVVSLQLFKRTVITGNAPLLLASCNCYTDRPLLFHILTRGPPLLNLSEIEESPAELLIIWQFLHTLCHAVISTFDLLTLNFYSTSGVMRLNFLQNLSEIE